MRFCVLFFLACLPALNAWQHQRVDPAADKLSYNQPFHPFDWRLWKVLARTVPGNTVFSPISVRILLGIMYEGSSGYTMREFQDALNLQWNRMSSRVEYMTVLRSLMTRSPNVELSLGTKVYVNETVTAKYWYQRILSNYYDAQIEKLSFDEADEARSSINNWVEAVTRNRIKDFLSSDAALKSSVVLLINAIYFKGTWQFPFPHEETFTGNFYTPRGNKQVRYMSQSRYFYFSRAERLKARILSLPYMDNKFVMYIVLPDDKNGLDQLIENIDPVMLRNLTLDLEETPLQVYLPQFKFDSRVQLKGLLQQVGIRKIFDSTAEMRGLLLKWGDTKDLIVSEVVQKAGIEVNENGTVAAAATEFQLVNKYGGMDEEFHADRPFMFFIEEQTQGTVVFVGKCVDPTAGGDEEENEAETTTPATKTMEAASRKETVLQENQTKAVNENQTKAVNWPEEKIPSPSWNSYNTRRTFRGYK